MNDFKPSTYFSNSSTCSSLQELIDEKSVSPRWREGAIQAYALAIRLMVQGDVGSMAYIGKILGESEDTIFKLYNMPPNRVDF